MNIKNLPVLAASCLGLALSGHAQTLEFNQNFPDVVDYDADIVGSVDVFQNGTGTTILSGTNTFTGTTTLNAGIMAIDEDGRLGNAANQLVFDGGTLRVDSVFEIERDIVLNIGGGTIFTPLNDVLVSGGISGVGGLTKSGAGELYLAGAPKTYQGETIVTGGTVYAEEDDVLSASSALVLGAGTTLDASSSATQSTAGLSGSGDLVLSTNSFTVDSGVDQTFSGVISGNGTLIKTGTAFLTLSGSNTYSGGTEVDGGGISIASDGNLGAPAGGLSLLNGAQLRLTAGVTSGRDISLSGGAEILTTAGNSTLSGTISGTDGLSKFGSGSLALTGTNSYTGHTTVNAGRLSINSDDSLGAAGGNLTLFDATTLATTATFSSARGIQIAGSAVNFEIASGTTFTATGAIEGSAGLNKLGTGTLMLSGTAGQNDYDGQTTVQAGSLRAASANVFNATSNMEIYNGANINLDGFDQTIGRLGGNGQVLLGSGALTVDSDSSSTFQGRILGSGGSLVKEGTGTLTLLNTTSDYSGGTAINDGILVVADDSNLGAAGGGLSFDGGTLKLRSTPAIGTTMNRAVTLNAGGGTVDTTGRSLIWNGVVSGNGGLTKTGSGTLTLGNSGNSYLGDTVLNGGALAISNDGALGHVSSAVTLGGGSFTINGTVTSGRVFQGNGALIKNGFGTLELTGTSNTYTGGTIVNSGTLRFTDDSSLGAPSSPVTISGGGLSAAGTLSGTQDLTLASSSTFEVLPTYTATWGGDISGAYTLTKTGSGTLRLTGNNAHNGFRINSGTLALSSDQNIGGASSTVAVNSGGILAFDSSATISRDLSVSSGTFDTGSNNVVLTGQLSHVASSSSDPGFTKIGSGDLTIHDSALVGVLTLSGGRLLPGAAGALSSFARIALSGGTELNLNGFNTQVQRLSGSGSADLGANTLTLGTSSFSSYSSYDASYGGNISGTGGLTKTGANTQTLTGTNSYSGGTTVNGGELIFGNASAVPNTGQITNTAYVGTGFAIDQAFLDQFNKAASSGTIGVNASTANPLNLTGFAANASLGTTVGGSGVDVSGTLTPQGSVYRFANGFGRMNVSSNLTGSRSVTANALTLHLSGVNTYTGGTTAGFGGLVIFDFALPGSGQLLAESGGYIGSSVAVDQVFLDRFDKANTEGTIGLNTSTSSNLDLTGFGSNATLGTNISVTLSGTITPQGTNYRFGGSPTGSPGTLTVTSNLTGARGVDIGRINLVLQGINTYAGNTTLSSGGVIAVDNDSRLGTGTLILNNSTYNPTTTFSSSRQIQVNGSGTISTGVGVTLTQNGTISGDVLQKSGSGTLNLAGNNSISGLRAYNGETNLNSVNALSSSAILEMLGGTVNLGSISRTIGTLESWGGILDTGSATLSVQSGYQYGGEITGGGILNKTGSGTLDIEVANTHTGGTTVSGGTLEFSNNSAFGSGDLTLSGGTLRAVGNRTISNTINVSSNSTLNTQPFFSTDQVNISGGIEGSADLNVTGFGRVTLNGTTTENTHTGTIALQSGQISLVGAVSSDLSIEGGIIIGEGSTAGALGISGFGAVLPGGGGNVGTLLVGSLEFGVNGSYDWEISGMTSMDLIEASGAINITATDDDPFVLKAYSLTAAEVAGIVPGFDMASNYLWVIASGSSVTGFSPDKFSLDLTNFYNPADASLFSVAQQGNSIVIQYAASAIPEPSTALLAILGAAGLAAVRRRVRQVARSNQ